MPKTQIEKPLTSKEVEKVVAKAFSGLEFKKAVAGIVTEVLFDFWEKVIEPVMVTKDEHQTSLNGVNKRTDKIDSKLEVIEGKISSIQNQINDLKWDTPSRTEFTLLKKSWQKIEHRVLK